MGWLIQGETTFFCAGGIFENYRTIKHGSLRKKLAQAETHAKSIYDNRTHSSDPNQETEDLPAYAQHFFDYFEYKQQIAKE